MITFDFRNAGLSEADLEAEVRRSGEIAKRLGQARFGFTELPYREEVAQRVLQFASERRGACRNFLQIGIGGSALGATALVTALGGARARPQYHVLDNVDPEETRALLDGLNPRETFHHVVTKSGETTETIAGFIASLDRAKKALGDDWRRAFAVTTGAKGFLRRVAEQEKLPIFDVPEAVGGRYSVLSPVGLLPAAFLGIDVRELLAGAILADEMCRRSDARRNFAYMFAAVAHLLDRRGRKIHVMMPYARALLDVADWWRQLWAESLGKKADVGPTPLLALGATDQHSQVQLFNEGPDDKYVIFLTVDRPRADEPIPALFPGDASCDFIQGRKFSDVMAASKLGTESALTANGRSNATVSLPEITPRSIGGLLYALEMATAAAGWIYDVNPFDQPGVEAGKRATFGLLGRPGFPPPSLPPPDPRFLVR